LFTSSRVTDAPPRSRINARLAVRAVSAGLLLAGIATWAPAERPGAGMAAAGGVVLAADTPDDAEQPAAEHGLLQIIFAGGVVGVLIMLTLLGLSLTAAYLVFDQAMTLRAKELMPEGLSDLVADGLAAGSLKQADAACREHPSCLAVVVRAGLAEVEGGYAEVERAMEETLAEQAARMMRKIEYLSVIGNIAPMVGLLGTVIGMVFAFRTVAATQAAGADELAEGIYQALVTTVGGLLVAIPALGAFAVLRNRVDQLTAELAYAASQAVRPLKRLKPKKPTPPPVT
jgi:biopolymer transport protein ExbB